MLRMVWSIALVAVALYALLLFLAWAFQSRLIYPASQEIHEPQLGYGEMELRTRDGLILRGFIRSPNGDKPTIVYFHGNGGTLAGSMAANEAFARAGYGLLLVNYRGYGGNPGSPSEEGFYEDGRAAMRWLMERDREPGDIVIAANSIGSGTAVQMASEFDVKALLLTAPFTSLHDVAAEGVPFLPVRWLMRDRFDNAAKIGALDLPILIQHGTADRDVPVHHGKALAERARGAELQLFEGAAHDLVWRPQSQAARLEWLEALE